ncbi:NUDIX domain-containing protein [Streptomyces sp. NBC_01236]|uniref:NUDIX domain-containing protein n=1 Tax=Streptomyces sp. NBC_01236 TaxID=2903789 RepID=UPI002E0FC933|nr:NUDIX domain-containing protein [Streptomyces sp. NBC_01236]
MYLHQIALDAHDPQALARFWASLLGGTAVARDRGAVHVAAPGFPQLAFQPVLEGGAGGDCRPFEIAVADIEATCARAGELGAANLPLPAAEEQGSFQPMRDPEGNEFRLVLVPPVPPVSPAPTALPGAVAKARVLFTDSRGRILLVRFQPRHNERHWGLPGGTVEAGRETPRQAAVREIREETGLRCTPGRLLSVDWVNRTEGRPRMVHVFDGGPLEDGDLTRIRLQEAELAEWRMCSPEEAEALLPPVSWGQLRQSLAVLAAAGSGPAELVDGVPAGP